MHKKVERIIRRVLHVLEFVAGLFATRRFLIPKKAMKVELSEVE